MLPCLIAMAGDIFGFFFIDVRKRVTRTRLGMKKFIKLGLDCLRIPVLGSLDEQRHEPRRHGR